jgi:DeoR/GlpR family transcriptional regulator of sugar metabolism
MLKEERFETILQKLQKTQKVLSTDLSHELRVSEDTIRRDLKELADAGLLTKVHGGALLKSTLPLSFREREQHAEREKLEIARKAAALPDDGQLIILDGGTTTLQIARLLPESLRATVFTNSPPIALQLADHPGVEVVLAGGKLRKEARVTVGIETAELFRGMHADWCMLGVCSLHHEWGLTLRDREEVQVKAAMIRAASQVVALATADKIGPVESFVVAPPNQIDLLITDSTTPPEVLDRYRALGIEVR